jgi:hypothetical protein
MHVDQAKCLLFERIALLICVNSEVSYQLDHAPEDRQNIIGLKHFPEMHPTGIHCGF